jgi:hypothetical protein
MAGINTSLALTTVATCFTQHDDTVIVIQFLAEARHFSLLNQGQYLTEMMSEFFSRE